VPKMPIQETLPSEELQVRNIGCVSAPQSMTDCETRFRQLVECLPAAVAMVDRQMQYLAVSQPWQTLCYRFGEHWSGGEFPEAQTMLLQLPPYLQEICQRCLEGGQGECLQDSWLQSDGTVDWVRWQIQPWRDSSGHIGGLLLCYEAVAPKQLAEALQLTQFAMDKAADAIFWMKPDGKISYANEAASELLGYSSGELRNLNAFDIDPNLSDSSWATTWQSSKENGSLSLESEYRTKEGRFFPVEVRVNYLAFKGGEYLCAFVRDVTDHHLAAAALQHANEQLHAVLDAVPGLVSWIDSDLRYIGVNRHLAAAFNMPPAEFAGKEVGFLENSPKFGDMVRQFFADLETTASQEVSVNIEGESKHYLIVSQKYHENRRAVFVGLDISDRRQMEAALRQSEEHSRHQAQKLDRALQELQRTQTQLIQTEKMSSLGQLVAGIAHEINNPVSFIFGNIAYARQYASDLLELVDIYTRQYPLTPEIEAKTESIGLDFLRKDFPRLLSSMQSGADRIREVVLSLRNFSRLDEAQKKPVDLHSGIDSTLLIVQNRLTAKAGRSSIQLIKDYGELPQVECYPGQLNQVFMHLLTNAIDAIELDPRQRPSSQGGSNYTISIRTRMVDPNHVEIRIIDNGPGMTDTVKQRVFEMGFTTKPVGKGTGLGLSISHQIVVEKHGGQLNLHSTPGEGTEFAIILPICQSKEAVNPLPAGFSNTVPFSINPAMQAV